MLTKGSLLLIFGRIMRNYRVKIERLPADRAHLDTAPAGLREPLNQRLEAGATGKPRPATMLAPAETSRYEHKFSASGWALAERSPTLLLAPAHRAEQRL